MKKWYLLEEVVSEVEGLQLGEVEVDARDIVVTRFDHLQLVELVEEVDVGQVVSVHRDLSDAHFVRRQVLKEHQVVQLGCIEDELVVA